MDIQKKIEEIRSKELKNAKKIAIQLPEGLKKDALKIAKKINKEVFILADSCFGACDLRDSEANELGCDLLIHVGHSPMNVKSKVPTVYIEVPSSLNVEKIVKTTADKIKEKKVGLLTTIQHVNKLEKVKQILESKGKKVFIGKPSGRAKYAGQVLGCDFKSAESVSDKVDCFLFIGTGTFHAIGTALSTNKKVYRADPEMNRFEEVSKDLLLRKRFAQIEKARNAKNFGIILSLKPGQKREKLALDLKKKIEKAGKNALILAMDFVNPDNLLGFQLDCYVNTACPRIALDDSALYEKSILTPQELEILLGLREWKDYKIDSF